MEILSTGEKIKRARIYKGLTLRELCKEKISVSKMSCIENNKIKAEPWVLEFVSEHLDVDLDYLKKDVEEHLLQNYEVMKSNISNKDIQDKLKLNIEYAETFKYYDLAMRLMHLLVGKLVNERNIAELKEIMTSYYGIYEKAYSVQNQITYFIDLATFLCLTQQHEQAATYFKNVRLLLLNNSTLNFDFDYEHTLCDTIYKEAACSIKAGDYKTPHNLLLNNEVHIIAAKQNKIKFMCYSILALLCYRKQEKMYKDYRDKALLFYVKDEDFEAKLGSYIVLAKLELEENSEALKYADRVISLFPDELSDEHIELIFRISYGLIKAKLFKECSKIIIKAVDNAILLENPRLIEEAYYISALLAIGQKNKIAAETNMCISLDYLKKIGTKEELYYRYIEIGDMYYDFNNVKDSLKYFNLALYTSNSF